MKKKPTAKDWIILRLLCNLIYVTGPNEESTRSLGFLVNKLGFNTVCKMSNQLKKEKQRKKP